MNDTQNWKLEKEKDWLIRVLSKLFRPPVWVWNFAMFVFLKNFDKIGEVPSEWRLKGNCDEVEYEDLNRFDSQKVASKFCHCYP